MNLSASSQTNRYSPNNRVLWLRRYARDLSEKYTISNVTLSSRDDDLMEVKKERKKRQSPGRSTLCKTSTQYIMPQAALNNKGLLHHIPWDAFSKSQFWFTGNWMFVVNADKSARQLVKTEFCS